MKSFPRMDHLPGFWDQSSWANDKWDEFLRRKERDGRFKNWLDQWWHRWWGRVRSREAWERREAKQWENGSGTGAYDFTKDDYNQRKGAGDSTGAAALKHNAQLRRKEFLA